MDRARPAGKHHSTTDGQGNPLAVSLTGGNHNDVTQRLPLLDKIPAVAGVLGRSRRRPAMLFTDRGYDHDKCRRPCMACAASASDGTDATTRSLLGIATLWNWPTRQ